jgi:cobalt-zinc-cadmium efflux system protein
MHHDHSHHDHDHVPSNKKILLFSFILISSFMLVEFIGGLITNSLALLSDAGHMLSDSFALGIALAALYIGQRHRNAKHSFGYQRIEILVASINGLSLILIALWIFVEAIIRFGHPQLIDVQGMLLISLLGLVVNLMVAWILFRSSDTEHDLNMRGAFLHVLSDLFGSVGAIAAALCIYFFNWNWADPLASIFVAILVLRSGLSITLKAGHILMQGTPERFASAQIQQHLRSFAPIVDVHDLHIWSLNSKRFILTCHVVVDAAMSMTQVQDLLQDIEHSLEHLGIEHVTIQIETSKHRHQHDCAFAHAAPKHTSHAHHPHEHAHDAAHEHHHH